MFSVPALLDRAKHAAHVESDYALAKILGVHKANVSNWRVEKTSPDGRSIVKLCELSGDDCDQVAALIQAMRAANDEEAALWRRVASRLAGGVAAVVVCSVVLGAYAPSPALAQGGQGGLYIMSTLLVMRLALGLVRRVRSTTLLASRGPLSE